jgi:hypothetical protein
MLNAGDLSKLIASTILISIDLIVKDEFRKDVFSMRSKL